MNYESILSTFISFFRLLIRVICYFLYLFEILVPSNLKPIAVRILPYLAYIQRKERNCIKILFILSQRNSRKEVKYQRKTNIQRESFFLVFVLHSPNCIQRQTGGKI